MSVSPSDLMWSRILANHERVLNKKRKVDPSLLADQMAKFNLSFEGNRLKKCRVVSPKPLDSSVVAVDPASDS